MWHRLSLITTLLMGTLIGVLMLVGGATQIQAQTTDRPRHWTVISNQVRGSECCDTGSVEFFKQQTQTLHSLELPATFALRYDVLSESDYVEVIKEYPEFEYAAFLEIIPSLAETADVEYQGSPEYWYEAQYAYLIGYDQTARQKIIDTYMARYFAVFGTHPTTTLAWMIDAWSLRYLQEEYGVTVHQITREQFGTDSYALYGGPPHYPYWPTDNWALIPADDRNPLMPLIIRQTITDPVNNYGDTSNSYTSQPNDYGLRSEATFSYFEHLFNQAHQQPNEYTFALVGLENSMAEEFQVEFAHQLEFIKNWQTADASHQVATTSEFQTWLKSQPVTWPKVYTGTDPDSSTDSQAWWITTPAYRVRLRLDKNQLYISDWRLYHSSLQDPYFETPAENLGWWIVPFLVDGSRFWYQDSEPEYWDLARDNLSGRKAEHFTPTRIELAQNVSQVAWRQQTLLVDGTPLLTFENTGFELPPTHRNLTEHPLTQKWFEFVTNLSSLTDLTTSDVRQRFYPLLFPEAAARPLDPDQTYVYYNSRFAQAGRNPVRLVLFPRDAHGLATLLTEDPQIEATPAVDAITIQRQHGSNGMLFIDLENAQPLTTQVTITAGNFQEITPVFFAPNCKTQPLYCLTHPRQTWWYLRNLLNDQLRARQDSQ